jgi:hypothetical protein
MKKRMFLIFGIIFLLFAVSFSSVSAIRVGSCVDFEEGVCTRNSPENRCTPYGGLFFMEPIEELPQCEVGCCFYGSNSDITTRARCNALSENIQGASYDFDESIKDLQTCYEQTAGGEVGACVYEEQGRTRCERTTFSECNSLKASSLVTSADFSEGYLCTSELLGNLCGPTTQTTCDEDGRIYYLDNCGNKANIFDSSKYNDPLYWDKIIDVDESCNYGESNADSTICGNCDYLEGSYCGKAIRGEDKNPVNGDYICKDLSCVYKGNRYEHGEQWCATAEVPYSESMDYARHEGYSQSLGGMFRLMLNRESLRGNSQAISEGAIWTDMRPGTESYVLKCYYGEILTEDCSRGEFRNKVCQEVEINGISNAACQVNVWMDCIDQTEEDKCLDSDVRDCEWVEGYTLLNQRDDEGSSKMVDLEGNSVEASCVPKYSPAFEFWTEEGGKTAEDICSLSGDLCIVEYEFGLLRNRENFDENTLDEVRARAEFCSVNCQCLEGYEAGDSKVREREKFEQENYNKPWLLNYEDWKFVRDNTCFSLGDCGYSINAFGFNGTNTEKDSIIGEFFKKSKDFREEYGIEE